MLPGRELDALVAEKVFGASRPFCIPEGKIGTPTYSTSIAAAWEVVEKLNLLMGTCLTFAFDQWEIGKDYVGDTWEVDAVGETAAHAICLAALKSVGVREL